MLLTDLIYEHSLTSCLSEIIKNDRGRNSYEEKDIEKNESYKKRVAPFRPS